MTSVDRGDGRALIPTAALLWGLQFAFLNPSIGLLLASHAPVARRGR